MVLNVGDVFKKKSVTFMSSVPVHVMGSLSTNLAITKIKHEN